MVFRKKIPLANIFQAPTIEQFARIIHQQGGSTPESSLVALQPNGSKPPFFCVHTVGGNIFRYQSLARHLTPDQPVYGIQAQRFNGEYSPHTSVKDMATHYIKEIRSLQPEGPYFLGGFCIGGIIAFEMAQQIHAQGQKVALLALFETYGPEYRKISPNAGLIPYKIYHRAYDFIQRFDYHLNILRLHNTHEKKTYILERVQNLKKKITKNLTGWARLDVQESNELIPQDLQKVEKSILQAVQDYKPITYMGSITLFQARNKPSEWIHDPYLGWEKLAAGGIVTLEIPGWHTFILMEPGVRVLAKKLRKCLHIAQTNA